MMSLHKVVLNSLKWLFFIFIFRCSFVSCYRCVCWPVSSDFQSSSRRSMIISIHHGLELTFVLHLNTGSLVFGRLSLPN